MSWKKSNHPLATHLHEAVGEEDWLAILDQALCGLPNVYIVLDSDLLGHAGSATAAASPGETCRARQRLDSVYPMRLRLLPVLFLLCGGLTFMSAFKAYSDTLRRRCAS